MWVRITAVPNPSAWKQLRPLNNLQISPGFLYSCFSLYLFLELVYKILDNIMAFFSVKRGFDFILLRFVLFPLPATLHITSNLLPKLVASFLSHTTFACALTFLFTYFYFLLVSFPVICISVCMCVYTYSV